MKNPNEQLIVALDVDTLDQVKSLVHQLKQEVEIYKVGSQIFTSYGPEVVKFLLSEGKKIFLDLKYHDIPNTVANAVRSATALSSHGKKGTGIMMCTVHTVGGYEMLSRAVEAAKVEAKRLSVMKPAILGITVLTSEEKKDNITEVVLQRAMLAKQAGLDGVVASSQEAALLRKSLGKEFIIVTPGIRPKGSDQGDQKRVTTPFDAISNGSDYLVVGRPIVEAENPLLAAQHILEEIKQARNK